MNAVDILSVIAGAAGAALIASLGLPAALTLALADGAAFDGFYAGALMVGFVANLRILNRIGHPLEAVDRHDRITAVAVERRQGFGW